MPNPQHLGEYSKLYYIIGDTDITGTDSATLALSWVYLCVVDVSVTRARSLRQLVDRCTADDMEYTAGKRDTSVSVNINEIRLTDGMVEAWHQISDETGIVSLLILNSENDDADAFGLVGNFIVEQDDDTQPSEGDNVNALSYRPAAASAYSPKIRRIYGASFTP